MTVNINQIVLNTIKRTGRTTKVSLAVELASNVRYGGPRVSGQRLINALHSLMRDGEIIATYHGEISCYEVAKKTEG